MADVLMQVGWQTVPYTWARNTKATVAETVAFNQNGGSNQCHCEQLDAQDKR